MVAMTVKTFEPHEPIQSRFIRNEFMWDRMGDVNWDLLRGNLDSARRVLNNPSDFPKADFAAIERREQEIGDFLALHLEDRP